MNRVSIICFSLTGLLCAERLKEKLEENHKEVTIAKKSRYLEGSVPESIGEWTGREFKQAEAVIFVGACGIAVRAVAPYVTSKKKDPAVLVIDECGKFVISLLSGHLGGANELAKEAAGILGAVPVVTTATDLHGIFAVDVFAKKNQCAIFNMKAAKEVSAALLSGESVGFYSEFPWEGKLPDGIKVLKTTSEGEISEKDKRPKLGIAVTVHTKVKPFASTVQVVPRAVTLGMGCKKDKDAKAVLSAASETLKEKEIYPEAVEKIASISLKKNEPGLLALSKKWGVPFETYEAEELNKVPGEFTPSSFVNSITGVDNVCERSAAMGSQGGWIIRRKRPQNGVTTALALRDVTIKFE